MRLEILEEKIDKMTNTNSNIIDCYKDIKLEQNIPNPFDGVTEIKCAVPEKYGKNIKLVITDGTGLKEIKEYDLKPGIENTISVSAKDFETGAYIYGIQIKGETVKSKKMMIIK